MMPTPLSGALRPAIVLGFALAVSGLALAEPVHGQALPRDLQTHTWISVGPAMNAPNVFTGVSVFLTRPGSVGAFAEVRSELRTPADESSFAAGMTTADAIAMGDRFFRDRETWTIVNAGLTFVYSEDLAFYGGLGATRTEVFDEIEVRPQDAGERGEFGFYWVRRMEPETALNVTGGALFRAGRNLRFQFGAESRPMGFVIGAHYGFPL